MDWEEQDQVNEDLSSNNEKNSENDGDDGEETKTERSTIRSELKTMSFAELLKLKEELGSKVYNEALFGEESTPKKRNKAVKHQTTFKRENKNRPREISAKKQVPLLGKSKPSKKDQGPRDPRFDSQCGEFDRTKFKEDYGFVNEIREKEISELKEQLKHLKDDQADEKSKVKLLIQRMQNQNLEEKKLRERKQAKTEERQKNKDAIKNERKPFFMSKREQKAQDLVKQFEELKKSGKLNKHLEKRRKKNMSRDRKKYNFD
ncbi:ribosomal RNA processing protein 36 homolog [Sitodiplosis mosellana]|uniref:ribosomal RNA processing protein 36 homolog n=1 Tax=Sitodiplosis mosellana TaxID=263140 RepID=UPI0024444736|nr:ribosomal RNA processing protein 36 homolog [Sitodiplosis mosellana]